MIRKTDPPHLHYEQELWQSGLDCIAGMDEAGRGALAGPVAVGAVILPANHPHLSRILACCRDSKQMTPRQRDLCVPRIKEAALAWNVACASADEIDMLTTEPVCLTIFALYTSASNGRVIVQRRRHQFRSGQPCP